MYRWAIPLHSFIQRESSAGIVLFSAALVALVWANSPWASMYHALWKIPFTIGFEGWAISKSLHHWINDGLMSVFFFVVGLELKREIIGGQLANPRKALMPMVAAIGGMLVPAVVFLSINKEPYSEGAWGVPMATDIAFALGIMALLGDKVPLSLKVFLTALAITDDLGAVLVIAFFYTSHVDLTSLATGAGFMAILIGMNLSGVRKTWLYGLVGIGGVWLAFLLSGVHATIAGVIAAMAIPARTTLNEKDFLQKIEKLKDAFAQAKTNDNSLVTDEQLHVLEEVKSAAAAAETPLQKLEHGMHPLVSFIVMPVFALSNAGISLAGMTLEDVFAPLTLAVLAGLVFGKILGIMGFSMALNRFGGIPLPDNTNMHQLLGVSLLAGVGFTMSLFITELALENPTAILHAKLGILSASIVAGSMGYWLLRRSS